MFYENINLNPLEAEALLILRDHVFMIYYNRSVNISLIVSSNYEEKASELLENLEEMFNRYYM